MRDLNFQLKSITAHNRDGSFKTQADRHRVLQMCANQLHTLGYKLEKVNNLGLRHINVLIDHWKERNLSSATIKNYVSHLRWLSEKIGKPSLLPKSNTQLGIENRKYLNNEENKAVRLAQEQLGKIRDPHLKASIELQREFGLRKEEALKIRPEIANKGDKLYLRASWCKGGRERYVPVLTEPQRNALNNAKEIAKGGSLIPPEKSYKQQAKSYDKATAKAGFNGHGLRHQYAQDRYKELTGRDCPKAGGLPYKEHSSEQKEADKEARQVIAEELGHGRIEITNNYLGR